MPHLLHGEERVLYGDQAYWKEKRIARRSRRTACATGSTGARRAAIATEHGSARSTGPAPEPAPAASIPSAWRLWGFSKTRYRGLAKNLARAHTMFALANLYLVRRRLLPTWGRCR